MKLTLKLALAVLPGALVVVAAAAFLELRRDRAEFEADQRSDDRATAGAFADSMGKMWEAVGEKPVRRAMDRLHGFEARYRVSWVDLRETASDLPPAERGAVARGEDVIWRDEHSDPPGWLHAVSPVRADGQVVGAVDVSEPPPDLRAHVRRTIRATVMTTLALAATMMLMTLLVGAWVVGGPISVLIAQARRVAAGDLGARSLPRQRDELGELTRELNGMLDQLEAAAVEVRASTRERFDALEQLRHAERLTTVGRIAFLLVAAPTVGARKARLARQRFRCSSAPRSHSAVTRGATSELPRSGFVQSEIIGLSEMRGSGGETALLPPYPGRGRLGGLLNYNYRRAA